MAGVRFDSPLEIKIQDFPPVPKPGYVTLGHEDDGSYRLVTRHNSGNRDVYATRDDIYLQVETPNNTYLLQSYPKQANAKGILSFQNSNSISVNTSVNENELVLSFETISISDGNFNTTPQTVTNGNILSRDFYVETREHIEEYYQFGTCATSCNFTLTYNNSQMQIASNVVGSYEIKIKTFVESINRETCIILEFNGVKQFLILTDPQITISASGRATKRLVVVKNKTLTLNNIL